MFESSKAIVFPVMLSWLLLATSTVSHAQITADQADNIQRLANDLLSDWEEYLNIVGKSSFESEYENLDLSIFEDHKVPCLKPDFYPDGQGDLERNPLEVWSYLQACKTRLGFFSVSFSNQSVSPVYTTDDGDLNWKVKVDFDKTVTYENGNRKGQFSAIRQTMFFTLVPQDPHSIKIKGIRYFDPQFSFTPMAIGDIKTNPSVATEPPIAVSKPLPNYDPAKRLLVNRPHEGQVLKMTKSYRVDWKKSIEGTVNVELYRGSAFVKTIRFDETKPSFSWKVPKTLKPSKEYFLRVYYPEQPLESATSGVFRVKRRFGPLKWAAVVVGTSGLIGTIFWLTQANSPSSGAVGPLPPVDDPG